MKSYSLQRFTWSSIVLLLLAACSQRKPRTLYAGFNDLFMGQYRIDLYEDGRFSLELGAGSNHGNYTISNDTVFLVYDKPNDWPIKLLIRAEYFETLPESGPSKMINRIK